MSPGSAVHRASAFEAAYAPLRDDRPSLGEIAVLPWDAEVFGFRVADFRPGAAASSPAPAAELEGEIKRWARERDVELIGSRVSAADTPAIGALSSARFRFVELQLRATLPRLDPARIERPRLTVRPAEPADRARIVALAETAFTFGRYHADPRFPRELAARRFGAWMERALDEPSASTRVSVVGPPGAPAGFAHTELDASDGDVRLVAADPEAAALAGPALLAAAIRDLASRGAGRVTARLSAANTGALNLYASLGFRFHEPEIVLHWSRPGAAHRPPGRTA